MNRIAVRPALLRWARERTGRTETSLARKFPKLALWERGESRPTFRQLEQFAQATFVPFGYFFLMEPPVERLPIPDLRTPGNARIARPSPDLLDTLFLCQRRQTWYRDWARGSGEDARPFVGSARANSPVEETAALMRRALGFDLDARAECPTWTDALRQFIGEAEELGVLVMVSGVVGSNNHRKLVPEEFRGFALADDLAPLVFINGADTKAGQMFTLAHELAHLWLGESALTDATPACLAPHVTERWCDAVAAEFLVPLAALRDLLRPGDVLGQVSALARRFKVSTLVVLRRLHDAARLTREEFHDAYETELRVLRARPRSEGGDFYLTQAARLSRRFTRALVLSTLEGQTLYRDAFRMLGIARESTFRELSASVGYRA